MDSPEKTELKVKLGGLLQEIREVQEHLGCPVKTDLQEIREDSVCPEHPESTERTERTDYPEIPAVTEAPETRVLEELLGPLGHLDLLEKVEQRERLEPPDLQELMVGQVTPVC